MINHIDEKKALERCLRHRKRILEISQNVTALHIGSAFSCTEIVDAIYYELMKPIGSNSHPKDTFIMSKGHGCMIQYVILEDLGIISHSDIEQYCTKEGILGCHPDYGNPGIEASTGSLGHGLSMAVGASLADKLNQVFCVLSDGELQEGSTWEAIMMASSLGCNNLIAVVDNNDFQSLGRTSETHPSLYPIDKKLEAFGWEVMNVDGHSTSDICNAALNRDAQRPLFLVAKTTKGKGVSYMENVPIWHYRSPSKDEYRVALSELEGRQ